VELLLKNHLDYVAEFGSEKQSASWIAEKAIEHKNKFETDQRNQEAEMNCKRAVEEEECQDAVKQRKAVAESSVELVAAFK
jgi:predicted transcriptional regulator